MKAATHTTPPLCLPNVGPGGARAVSTFSRKVRRLAAGVNKARLARLAGLPESTISNYLSTSSVPRADIALKIARALEVPLEWLADDEASGDPPSTKPQPLAHVSDADLMAEACRRLVLLAARSGVLPATSSSPHGEGHGAA